MNPQGPDQTNPPLPGVAPAPILKNPLATANPGEQLVCEIKRHPIGIMAMYVGTAVLIITLAILAFLVAPRFLASYDKGKVYEISTLVFIVVSLIALSIMYIAHRVYWGNIWVVTSDNITQIKQITLFYKQTSQLSLANLEDITAEQNGLLAQIFHYGVISAETAAATDKFTFIYCPNPTYYTQQILSARERFEARRRESTGVQNQGQPPASAAGPTLTDTLAGAGQSIDPGQ